MQALFFLILTLAILIVVHEFGHFWVARRCGVKVLTFSVGFGRTLWRKQGKDGTEYRVGIFPLGGYVKMLDEREGEVADNELGQAFNRQSLSRRVAIVAAGPLANLLFAVIVYWFVFMAGVPALNPIIGSIEQGSAADRAGLQYADVLLSADGEQLTTWRAWLELIRDNPDTDLAITIERDGQSIILTIRPEKTAQGFGRMGMSVNSGQRDVPTSQRPVFHYSVIGALNRSIEEVWSFSTATLGSLAGMVTGTVSTDNLGGPIIIAQYASHFASEGFIAFLSFLAMISISLGLLNLLPIPILDGGHLLLYFVELLRGEALSDALQLQWQRVGIVALLLLMSLAFYNDLSRLFVNH